MCTPDVGKVPSPKTRHFHPGHPCDTSDSSRLGPDLRGRTRLPHRGPRVPESDPGSTSSRGSGAFTLGLLFEETRPLGPLGPSLDSGESETTTPRADRLVVPRRLNPPSPPETD